MKKNLLFVYTVLILLVSSFFVSIFIENSSGYYQSNDLKNSQNICYYTLTINIIGNGSVVPPGGSYYVNTVVNLTAIPEDGWSFSHWSGDLNGTNNPETIVMDSDKTVDAHFYQEKYTLNFTYSGSGSGLVLVDPVGPYLYGDIVYIEAIADDDSFFVYWGGDHSGNDNPDYLMITGDMAVDACFDLYEMYLLNLSFEGDGSVTLNPPGGEYFSGTIVNLTAKPDFGWTFIKWSGDLEGNENPKNITMNSDKMVTAHFIKNDSEDPFVKIIKPKKNLLYVFNIPRRILFFKNTEIVGFIVIKAEATDDQGINRVEFYIDNELRSKDVAKPYNYLWMPKLKERGKMHTIKVIAYDEANNSNMATIEVKAGRLIRFFHNHPQLSRLGSLLLFSNLLRSKSSAVEPQVIYEPNSPIAYIEAPLTGSVGIEIEFDGSKSYDPNGDEISYEWDFGDGTNEVGKLTYHTYEKPGEYNITLTVSDEEGNFGTISKIISIYDSETEKQVAKSGIINNNMGNFIWYGLGAIAGLILLVGTVFFIFRFKK